MSKNTEKTSNSADTAELQEAARKLEVFLTGHGYALKHSVALEALSHCLGAKNWRTLRAKLNAPGAAAKVLIGADEPRWTVMAVYTDNDQRFSQDYHGATALEAQLACQLDRLADSGWMTRVEISGVIDRLTGNVADEESFTAEASVVSFTDMVAMLCKLAEDKLGEPPKGGIAECETYDQNMRALEFWGAVCDKAGTESGDYAGLREELDGMYSDYAPEYASEQTEFTDSRGVLEVIDVLDAFERLLTFAEQGVDTSKCGHNPQETGVFQVLQARLTLTYFEEPLSRVLNGWDVEAVASTLAD